MDTPDYSFQTELVERVWNHLQTDRKCVLAAGCGAGKTRVAADIIAKWLAANPGGRVLFLAHAQRLLRAQTAAVFAADTRFTSTELGARGARSEGALNAQVHVAIPQTSLTRAQQGYGLIVTDEAHQYADGAMHREIRDSNPDTQCLMLTASHARYTWLKWPVVTFSIISLWERGVVVDPTVEVISTPQEFRQFLNAEGDLLQSVALERIPELIAPFRDRFSAGKHLIACHNQDAALEVATYIGETAVLSTVKSDNKGAEIARFQQDPDVRVLVVVFRGILGFNMPELETVVDLTGSENVDRVFQLLGRVIRRPASGTKDARYYKLATESAFAWVHYLMSGVMMLMHPDVYSKWDGKLGSLRVPFTRPESNSQVPKQLIGETVTPLRQKPPRIPRFGDVIDVMLDGEAGTKLTSLATVRSLLVGGGVDPDGKIEAIWKYWDENGRAPPVNHPLYKALRNYTSSTCKSYRPEVRAEAIRRGMRLLSSSEERERAVIAYCEAHGKWPSQKDADPVVRALGKYRSSRIARSPEFRQKMEQWREAAQQARVTAVTAIRAKPIRCVETGHVYESASAAARALGRHPASVGQAVRNGHKCGGFHWEYVDDSESDSAGGA